MFKGFPVLYVKKAISIVNFFMFHRFSLSIFQTLLFQVFLLPILIGISLRMLFKGVF
jgi:hypothetical protein